MSQDELDELFGEEMSEVSQIEEENLKVSKFTDSEGEKEQHSGAEAEEVEEEEEETITTNSSTDISELTLTSVQRPSNQGLIVRISL